MFLKTKNQHNETVFGYYHHDHLDAPIQITDKSGNILWAARYHAFGKATITTSSIASNLRFPGQYHDDETGMHYNWHRYYDPDTGRYITEDPIGLLGGLNRYTYVNGNPLFWSDPWGLVKTLCEALKEVAGRSDKNPFLNDPNIFKFVFKLGSEDQPGDGDASYRNHYIHTPTGISYDIQYIQMGWAFQKSMLGSPELAMYGWVYLELLVAHKTGNFDYFVPESFNPNYSGLKLGEEAAEKYDTFKEFVSAFCDEPVKKSENDAKNQCTYQ
ncbi:RHS repeat domain-containing protein [Serratia sp. MMO-24]|uniref:RHS repeat domain-containing protein n=1 Tax=Serratia sp. MMO-24 TaxID=3081677 RepID=UPI0030762978